MSDDPEPYTLAWLQSQMRQMMAEFEERARARRARDVTPDELRASFWEDDDVDAFLAAREEWR